MNLFVSDCLGGVTEIEISCMIDVLKRTKVFITLDHKEALGED
jgi:hypothetical protein